MSTEPWQAFYDQPTFLPPGQLARWHREEAAIRAEEQRREAERAERAEIRQELALWEARQYSLARGLEWDPAKPFANLPSVYDRADAMFSLQDAAQRDADRRSLRDAGLEHLLGDLPQPPGVLPHPPGVVESPAGSVPSPEPTSAGSSSGTASRYGLPRGVNEPGYVRMRIRRFFREHPPARKANAR